MERFAALTRKALLDLLLLSLFSMSCWVNPRELRVAEDSFEVFIKFVRRILCFRFIMMTFCSFSSTTFLASSSSSELQSLVI